MLNSFLSLLFADTGKTVSLFHRARRSNICADKCKCLPILLYGSDSCPPNAAVKHSFEFTLNGVVFKIFDALPKDTYRDICKYFGVDPIEELISVRQSKFILRYYASEGDVPYVGRFLSYDSRL